MNISLEPKTKILFTQSILAEYNVNCYFTMQEKIKLNHSDCQVGVVIDFIKMKHEF